MNTTTVSLQNAYSEIVDPAGKGLLSTLQSTHESYQTCINERFENAKTIRELLEKCEPDDHVNQERLFKHLEYQCSKEERIAREESGIQLATLLKFVFGATCIAAALTNPKTIQTLRSCGASIATALKAA